MNPKVAQRLNHRKTPDRDIEIFFLYITNKKNNDLIFAITFFESAAK